MDIIEILWMYPHRQMALNSHGRGMMKYPATKLKDTRPGND